MNNISRMESEKHENIYRGRSRILLNSRVCEKPKTNADRIRSFSDEELAELITSGELCAICPVCQYYGTNDCYMENEGKHKNCDEGIMQWLQSEVEE